MSKARETQKSEQLPSPKILRAYASDQWTVAEAISELVDNSFGAARGNASKIFIDWNPKTRRLVVTDNGEGMKDSTDLLRPGAGVGKIGGDIGQFGIGGKRTILYMSDEVNIFTMRGGEYSQNRENVKKRLEAEEWLRAGNIWKQMPLLAKNSSNSYLRPPTVPSRLRGVNQGTCVAMKVRKERRVLSTKVIPALEKTFAPALRKGLVIEWNEPNSLPIELSAYEPRKLDHLICFDIFVGQHKATVKAGISDEVSISAAGLDVTYGHRSLRRVKAEVMDGYTGGKIWGYIDLDTSWPLSTTKIGISDDGLWELLCLGLSEQLSELTSKLKKEAIEIAFLKINLALQLPGNGRFQRKEKPDGGIPKGTGKGKSKSGSGANVTDQSGGKDGGNSVRINVTAETDDQLDGRVFQADVQIKKKEIDVYVNENMVKPEDIKHVWFIRAMLRAIADKLVYNYLYKEVGVFPDSRLEYVNDICHGDDVKLSDYIHSQLCSLVGTADGGEKHA